LEKTLMPCTPPTSVILKINKTSVMLYASQYVRLPDGRGASSQTYLASFSRNATEMPAQFEIALREATRGRPERYQSLMGRIDSEVLGPARIRQRLEETARQRRALTSALRHVVQGLTDIPEMPGYPIASRSAEFQQLLPELQTGAAHLLHSLNKHDSTTTVPQEAPEQRLQRLLTTVNDACAEIAKLMPEASNAFRRGYRFEAETLSGVRQLWFRTSDAVAALSARGQFRRPRNWSTQRVVVMAGMSMKKIE